MAFNNNVNTNNNGSDSNCGKEYNPRTATTLISANGEKLIPLAALDKFFPSYQFSIGPQLRYPSAYLSPDDSPMNQQENVVSVNSSAGPVHQYPVQDQPHSLPGPATNTANRDPEFNRSIGTGPDMQNMHAQTISNMTSGMKAGVNPISSSHSRPSTSATYANTNYTATPCTLRAFISIPDNEPGLYQQIGRYKWRCTYQECGKVTRGTRDKIRHIGKHARQEHKLIDQGVLKRENAIAIPKAQLLTYECKIPDCPFFLETGEWFYVDDYRVDNAKATHIQDYHRGRITIE